MKEEELKVDTFLILEGYQSGTALRTNNLPIPTICQQSNILQSSSEWYQSNCRKKSLDLLTSQPCAYHSASIDDSSH